MSIFNDLKTSSYSFMPGKMIKEIFNEKTKKINAYSSIEFF